MALPKVTYGQYNYGQYANPRAIQYKGGFGEGLAQAAVKFAEGFEKGKKEATLAKEQAYMASTEYEKEINKALGNAQSQNREFVIGLKQEVGDLVKNYKLGKISLDQYSKSMDKYNGYLNDLQLMRGTIEQIASSDNPEIDLKDVRFGLDNIGAAMTRNNLQKQNFIISENATEDGLNFSLPSGLPSDFKLVNMSVKDLIKDNRYYTPQVKFNFDAAPIANSLLKNIKNSKEGNEAITYTRRSIGNKIFEYGKIKSENIDPYLSANLNKDLLLGALTTQQKEAYFEDSIEGNKTGDYTGSEEQNQQIYSALSNEIKNKLLNLEFDRKDVTQIVNRKNQEKIDLVSAQNEFKAYTKNIDGIKNYLIDKQLELGDEIKDGTKPGSIVVTKNYKDKEGNDLSQSYELDFTNKDTWRFMVGGRIKNDLRKFYGGSRSITDQLGQFNIDQAYDDFMKEIKNITPTKVKFNPNTGEFEEKNNVEKAFEMDIPFIQQLKQIGKKVNN